MWFEKLTGFKEESPEQVRSNLLMEGDCFISKANHRKFCFGQLELPTLSTLREMATKCDTPGPIKVSEVVADVSALHRDAANQNSLFQAASQFNLLEMVGPQITPKMGIDRYESDHTQGPACAIACGAGTIYRNYFARVGGEIGQTQGPQIDCLDQMGNYLGNDRKGLWTMQNGYAMLSREGLLSINKTLNDLTAQEREHLKGLLKIGIQWNTEVTIADEPHKVSQAYCSALPIAYHHIDPAYWEGFARLVLEAAYEATLYAGMINWQRTDSRLVYLTLLGGGAFGNASKWIFESLEKALDKFRNIPLDIRVVSYSGKVSGLAKYLNNINEESR